MAQGSIGETDTACPHPRQHLVGLGLVFQQLLFFLLARSEDPWNNRALHMLPNPSPTIIGHPQATDQPSHSQPSAMNQTFQSIFTIFTNLNINHQAGPSRTQDARHRPGLRRWVSALALLPHALEDLRRAIGLRLQGLDHLAARGSVEGARVRCFGDELRFVN